MNKYRVQIYDLVIHFPSKPGSLEIDSEMQVFLEQTTVRLHQNEQNMPSAFNTSYHNYKETAAQTKGTKKTYEQER